MPRKLLPLLFSLLTLLPLITPEASLGAELRLHHRLDVALEPASHGLRVTDRVTLEGAEPGEKREFLLSARLEIEESSPRIQRIPTGDVSPFLGINTSSEDLGVELVRYRFTAPEDGILTLTYGGEIADELGDLKEEYTRGFRETSGWVGEEGVFLAGQSFWVPRLGPGLFTFELEAVAPEGWHLISQGAGSSGEGSGRARWAASQPMEEIYLVGGPLEIYQDSAGAVEALVYLRQRDDALAGKYLEATAQYVEMYRELIGPYPYSKFALVENFWETGYGMPSFTLLGPTVIRFPFILHSSYPHEILHNWWGNSVFVDVEKGNWCEGLTAYLADHLVKEQRGQGAEHRRATLQKYRDYVKEGRDFPLVEFRSRHSAATEAVGYGKTLMGFHMLRQLVGDEVFAQGLQRFYRQYRGQRASFADIEEVFKKASGEDLGPFFEEWITRPGAAKLAVTVDGMAQTPGSLSYRIRGRIDQLQDGPPFRLRVPLALQTAAGTETASIELDGSSTGFDLVVDAQPLALHVDPAFDVFRLLDPRETPPSIGQIFGDPEVLAVLPSAADEAERAAYRDLAEGWASDAHAVEVRRDDEISELPEGKAIWILGRENRFAGELFKSDASRGLEIDGEGVTIERQPISFVGHSLVLIRRHPASVEKAVGWLVVDPPEAFAGMARKLPHYGKYSYLGFEGSEPTNTVKGQWAATDSPLRVDLRPVFERREALPPLELPPRQALAELPPVFSQKALAAHVKALADPALEGRGLGEPGLRTAIDYVVAELRRAGLEPGDRVDGEGEDGDFLQSFKVAEGPDGEPVETWNVIAVLPGSREDWRGQSVILSAHLDHLGRGWPDIHEGDEGEVHPGADDNASGVAVVLELAKAFAAGERPPRSLVFLFPSAEEAGRLGSKHYVENPTPFSLDGIWGVINLDTVGRLGDQKLTVLGTGTSEEWPHIFRGVGFVTGIEARNVPGSAEGSDQWSFIERGVPGVQIHTGPHTDYHRPGDTAEKVDVGGLVEVATFVKEALAYLVTREEPLTVTIEGSVGAAPTERPTSGRRVSFGSVPDFAHQGPGVRLGGVVPGSPAEAAGLREGDVVLRIDGQEIADLRAFSDLLKTLEAGQTVEAVVLREGQELRVDVTLEAR